MNVVNDISECILVKYPQAVVSQFGSFPAGLATFLSDIDLSILNMGIDGEDDVALRSYRKRGAGQNFYQREKLSAEKVSDQPDDQHQSQVSPHASTDAVEDMEEQNNGSVLDLHGGFSDDQGTSGTNISWVIDKTGDSQHNVEKDMSSTEQMLEATVGRAMKENSAMIVVNGCFMH